MIAKIYSAIPQGYDGHIVEVEGDINQGLPSFNIVGMANKTISEARERVRSAIMNSDLSFPAKKVTINLAPAELTKDGSHLDLPIALAILMLSQQLLPEHLGPSCLFVGELSLDGHTKPIRGIINIVETAKNAGYQKIFVPLPNLSQAQLVQGIEVIGVSSLRELFLHLRNIHPINPPHLSRETPITSIEHSKKHCIVKNTKTDTKSTSLPTNHLIQYPLLDHIRGQTIAKRALSIAVAGRHNILLTGPPGSGKTLLAHVAANLLPPPSPTELIEITKLHTLSFASEQTITTRPFRSPHHTASNSAIIGGGPYATPGEISLAHQGVLFLDEFPEYHRNTIESLRQPLEDGVITISRANTRYTYPASFMLIATMNPCPCGYLGDPFHECTCTETQIQAYKKRISGPILDRIDMVIHVNRVPTADLMPLSSTKNAASSRLPTKMLARSTIVKNNKTDDITPAPHFQNASPQNTSEPVFSTTDITGSEHLIVKNKIIEAVNSQHLRYSSTNRYNSNLRTHELQHFLHVTPDAYAFLQNATDKLQLSARGYLKVLKVAQTIADFDGITEVKIEQISEALSFRQQDL